MSWRVAMVLVPALALYFLPLPGFEDSQRHLLAVFIGTIIALVSKPVPMGLSVLIATAILGVTRTVPVADLFSGFANPTVWLVFVAFLIGRAVSETGLGRRIAYYIIHRFGRSSLSLGYSIAASDVVLAPFIPSDTARGGGVIAPITKGLAEALGSEPGVTANRAGTFLMLVGFHTTYLASAIFLTGMAANPLIADFAARIAHVQLTWGRWLAASCVPGAISLITVPWLIYRLSPPELRDISPARQMARVAFETMGPLPRDQKWLVTILLLTMVGWVSSPWHGISNTVVALCAVCSLLLARVIRWDDVLGDKTAWDALIWFAPLVMMAEELNEKGVIKLVFEPLTLRLGGVPRMEALIILAVVYLYAHYGFASMTAHVTALYPGFLLAALHAGVPAGLAVLPLAYFSNLNAGITHYGTGSAPVYFGFGYVDQGRWWRIGFIVSMVNVTIWLGVGLLWWKLLKIW